MVIRETINEVTTTDADGNTKSTKTVNTVGYKKLGEPEYIKLYTKMWCEFNEIKPRWQELFLQLAIRMSYCRSSDLENSQTVNPTGPNAEAICKALNWGDKSNLYKGLRELCACGAIRKISRGWYQVNPSYAGKGEWQYKPDRDQGGIKDLVAKFSFKDRAVTTEITWDDNVDNPDIDFIETRKEVDDND